MKGKLYSCDEGTICIGTPEARACYTNDFGDGSHWVYVCRRNEKKLDYQRFKGSVEGPDIRVFDYDCLTTEECRDDKHVLFKLSGRYGIFAYNGTIVLEKWDEEQKENE